MSVADQIKIVAAIAAAGIEAFFHGSDHWPLARTVGYWVGGVLLAFIVAHLLTRYRNTRYRFASVFFWIAIASLLLSLLH